jgi:hypothetical protein
MLKTVGAAGAVAAAAAHLPGVTAAAATSPQATAALPDGTLVLISSTSDVFVPPRGRSFQRFSFDFPEPSLTFQGFRIGLLIFTYENCYALDPATTKVVRTADGYDLVATKVAWAGGQVKVPGLATLHVRKAGAFVEFSATVEMDKPIRAVTTVIRGVPRGRVSGGGTPFADPGDNEQLFGYPFSGGDLFGNVVNAGLTTPLVLIEENPASCFFISSLDAVVHTKRIHLQPGETSYRVECAFEAEGWKQSKKVEVPRWRLGRSASAMDAARLHYDQVERSFKIPRMASRPDAPAWMRRTALAVTLHGQHYTGYIFNDYKRQLEILTWIASKIPADRVLAFLAAWDGRYYWDYPNYHADERMGGDEGFKELMAGGQKLGFKMMPMFGANAANRNQGAYSKVASAFTEKPDGDRMDLNWVDWDNDRHQDGWLSYMNLGVPAWREWMRDRISDVIDKYRPDAYFLDIVGGYVNNTKADMHDGTRKLVLELRAKYPKVACVGEMHYDALLEFIPMFHSFGQTEITPIVQSYASFFQHLSSPAPGRGSSGVHEAGFGRFNQQTLGLRDAQIPTLMVVDDTFDKHRDVMDAVITAARKKANI